MTVTAWHIIAAILCLLILLALLRFRIVLSYTEELSVELRVLFLRFRLYPRKKKVKINRYTYKRYRKRLMAQRKKEAEKPRQTSTAPKKKKKRDLRDNLRLYTYLFKRLYERFLHYFRIDVAKLHVTVATGDAAKTAILTGVVSQSVAYVLEILRNHTNVHRAYRANVAVIPDYLGERSTVSCKLSFSLRVYQIIDLGIRFFYHFLVGRVRRQEQATNKEEKLWQKAN